MNLKSNAIGIFAIWLGITAINAAVNLVADRYEGHPVADAIRYATT